MKRGGTKVSLEQVAARLAFVETGLAALTPVAEVRAAFRKKFGVKHRCAEKYVQRVRDRWADEGKHVVERAAKRAEIERAADLTFREARSAGDYRVMIAALQLKTLLHGLNRPDDDAPAGDITVVFECEAEPADGGVPAAADVAPGPDPPGPRALPGPGRR